MKTDILIFIVGKILLCVNYVIINYVSKFIYVKYNLVPCINDNEINGNRINGNEINDNGSIIPIILTTIVSVPFLIIPTILMVIYEIITSKLIFNYRITYNENEFYTNLFSFLLSQQLFLTMFSTFDYFSKLEECSKYYIQIPTLLFLIITIYLIIHETIIYTKFHNDKIEFNEKYYEA